MFIGLFLFFYFTIISQVLTQTPEQIYEFIINDEEEICGSHFSDYDWIPEVEFCEVQCTSNQLCKVNVGGEDQQSKCFDLSKECLDAIRAEFGDGDGNGDVTEEVIETTETAIETTPTEGEPEPDPTTQEPDVDETTVPDGVETETTKITDQPTKITTRPTLKPGVWEKMDGQDLYSKCCVWAVKGACDYNPLLMRVGCQKSCGTYGCRVENVDKCQVNVQVNPYECLYLEGKQSKPVYPINSNVAGPYLKVKPSGYGHTPSGYVQRVTQSFNPPYQNAVQNCPDSHKRCSYWASIGECIRNEFWMKTRCQRSCNCCGCTTASLAGVTYTQNCNDLWERCPFWASKGECYHNPYYMNRKCKASCRQC